MKLFVTGLPGVGKTHFGKAYAASAGITFADLDVFITEKHGKSIAELMDDMGNREFRNLEKTALRELINQLAGQNSYVIATGGGTICYHDNLAVIKQAGLLVYLKDDLLAIEKRIKMDSKGIRPLLKENKTVSLAQKLEKMLRERRSFYEQSHIIVGVSGALNLHLFTKRLELFTG